MLNRFVTPDPETGIVLCPSEALQNSGPAQLFNVRYCGQPYTAFAVRFDGDVHAYVNRCSHVPMEMDYVPGQFFDITGRWLICATHGAMHAPQTGGCISGPCRSGLIKITTTEKDGLVRWHTAPQLEMTKD